MARTIPEPNENDREAAARLLENPEALAQVVAEVRWLRNLQHPEDPTVCRIQMFSPAGNSWAYFKSYYCAFQYALFLNEHTVDFALYRGDVTALHKTHSEIFISMTELERLAKEEQ